MTKDFNKAAMRWIQDQDSSANEDWVRLYVALRRANGPHSRTQAATLNTWQNNVTLSTTVPRNACVVERAPLADLCQPGECTLWTTGSGGTQTLTKWT